MKKGVMRPGHVQIRVLDLEAAVKHYTDLLGLIETDRDDQGRVYLKPTSPVAISWASRWWTKPP